jgi:hypothetical protein
MTMDTPQPSEAGETEVASDEISLDDAAKLFSGEVERVRDERGRFASTIEAEPEAQEAEGEAESHEPEQAEEQAAEEAQPESVTLPTSWPEEHAETWQTLPPEVQAIIAEREGQRDAAVNAKFQEAANVRKANEALITEAQQSRQRFVEAADHVLAMIQPQRPPLSMLTPGSADYNPDHYHLLNAQADQSERLIAQVQQQRHEALAQLTRDSEAQAFQQIAEIEAKSRPALLKAVPELQDPAKNPQALIGIINYAVENGIPQSVFTDPEQAKYVTSAQLLMAWKAQQFDAMQKAKAKVAPKAAKPAAPPVRPGVTTSKSAIEATQRKNAMERLTRSGSIEDAAAIFRNAF